MGGQREEGQAQGRRMTKGCEKLAGGYRLCESWPAGWDQERKLRKGLWGAWNTSKWAVFLALQLWQFADRLWKGTLSAENGVHICYTCSKALIHFGVSCTILIGRKFRGRSRSTYVCACGDRQRKREGEEDTEKLLKILCRLAVSFVSRPQLILLNLLSIQPTCVCTADAFLCSAHESTRATLRGATHPDCMYTTAMYADI